MARTTAPLLSWSAYGQIAKTQVYASWKGRSYVRRYAVPANPQTTEQTKTRSVFAALCALYQYLPAGSLGAWTLYGKNSQFTARNGWIKQNLPVLRGETDLNNIIMSPAAGGGLPATDVTPTPGDTEIVVDLTEPDLPVGWTITKAWAMAILDADPNMVITPEVVAGSDDTTPYSVTLTGLTNGSVYQVGGWFEYVRADGSTAYGVSTVTQSTPTA